MIRTDLFIKEEDRGQLSGDGHDRELHIYRESANR